MRLTTGFVVTAICALWGTIAGLPYVWVPYTGLAASIIDIPTRSWVLSNKLGEWMLFSSILKFAVAMIGIYGMLAQFACIGLAVYWIIK